jgi:hypothetical protein
LVFSFLGPPSADVIDRIGHPGRGLGELAVDRRDNQVKRAIKRNVAERSFNPPERTQRGKANKSDQTSEPDSYAQKLNSSNTDSNQTIRTKKLNS